jgi:hypothetical protein
MGEVDPAARLTAAGERGVMQTYRVAGSPTTGDSTRHMKSKQLDEEGR